MSPLSGGPLPPESARTARIVRPGKQGLPQVADDGRCDGGAEWRRRATAIPRRAAHAATATPRRGRHVVRPGGWSSIAAIVPRVSGRHVARQPVVLDPSRPTPAIAVDMSTAARHDRGPRTPPHAAPPAPHRHSPPRSTCRPTRRLVVDGGDRAAGLRSTCRPAMGCPGSVTPGTRHRGRHVDHRTHDHRTPRPPPATTTARHDRRPPRPRPAHATTTARHDRRTPRRPRHVTIPRRGRQAREAAPGRRRPCRASTAGRAVAPRYAPGQPCDATCCRPPPPPCCSRGA